MRTMNSTIATSRISRRTSAKFALAGLVAIATIAGAGAAGAQTPARATATAPTQAEVSTLKGAPQRSVPRLVREWEAAWNTGDGNRMAALFATDGVYQDFSLDYRFTGRAEIAQFVETSVRNVTGLHVTVTDAFRTGDRIGVRFIFSGQVNGAPRPFSVPVFTVMELSGNKITYDGDYYNRLDVLLQSGLPTS